MVKREEGQDLYWIWWYAFIPCLWPMAAFAALVGLLYPPKNPSWARTQKIAAMLLLASILAWILSLVVSGGASGVLVEVIELFALICFIAFIILGTICQRYHESEDD